LRVILFAEPVFPEPVAIRIYEAFNQIVKAALGQRCLSDLLESFANVLRIGREWI